MPTAFTRAVPPSIVDCALTHLEREPIDVVRATAQHEQYERALAALGCTVQRLPAAPALPDSVFVEDTAVVLPELAIITRPGEPARRAEVDDVVAALRPLRRLLFIEPPGTLDGGDVLVLGKRIFVGRSGRTNAAAIAQLRAHVTEHGYEVRAVDVTGCLHLKTAVTAVAEDAVLLNPSWVDPAALAGLEHIAVDPGEPFAANVVRAAGELIHPAAFARTRAILERRGLRVHAVPADELAKAEAGVSCCSLLVED